MDRRGHDSKTRERRSITGYTLRVVKGFRHRGIGLLIVLALGFCGWFVREEMSGRALTQGSAAGGRDHPALGQDRAWVAHLLPRGRTVPRFVEPEPPSSLVHLPVQASSRPDLDYKSEDRHPTWAPAMEASLTKAWFSADVFERLGLGAMKVTDLSCRQTTCKLSYEYPSSLKKDVAASGLPLGSPMQLVEEELGWAAPKGGGLRTRSFERDGQAFDEASLVLGFDVASGSPETYAAWVRGQRDLTREFFRKGRLSFLRRRPTSSRSAAGMEHDGG